MKLGKLGGIANYKEGGQVLWLFLFWVLVSVQNPKISVAVRGPKCLFAFRRERQKKKSGRYTLFYLWGNLDILLKPLNFFLQLEKKELKNFFEIFLVQTFETNLFFFRKQKGKNKKATKTNF